MLDFNNLPSKDKIYYQDESVVIYCADCREILPLFPDKSFDLVLTDPPYVGLKVSIDMYNLGGVAKHYKRSKTIGDIWLASHNWLPLVWGKLRYGLMQFCSFQDVEIPIQFSSDVIRIGLVCWYERNSPPSTRNRPHFMTQFIWLLEKESGLKWRNIKTHYDIPKLQAGCMAVERILNQDLSTAHPTQKPLRLISELLKVGGDLILDPFLGSGTTCVAAKILGRKCVGIEISEKYCEIAKKRCSQSVMQLEIPKAAVTQYQLKSEVF